MFIYPRYKFNFVKRYYKYFLRLNNRREHQTEFDFEVAKYPYITIGLINQSLPYQKEWIEWMDINIGKYRYFRIRNKLYFDNKDLMALYYMRWT